MEEDQISMQSHQAPAAQVPPSQEGAPSRPLMQSTPKKWVMQPLAPRLEPTDLRTMLYHSREQSSQDSARDCSESQGLNGLLTSVTSEETENEHDVLIRPRRVQVSEGSYSEDHNPSSPTSISSDSSAGSSQTFYSFVGEDMAKTEAWMVSPERRSKLATLKEEKGFRLQAYSEKKPEKLFQDDEEDSFYQVAAVPAIVQDDLEQIQERLEIIHGQAPKRKPVYLEQWEALQSLDLSNPPQRVLDGLSLYYSPSRADRENANAEPGAIDTERISFSEARQQFLTMEQSPSNPFQNVPQEPHRFANKGKPPQAEGGLVMLRRDGYNSLTGEEPIRSQTQESNSIRNDSFGSKGVTVFTAVRSCSDEKLGCESTLPPGHASDQYASRGEAETPIEKEIRLTQEREESLRRERGIKHTNLKEMVEIKSKPFLSQTGSIATPTMAREKSRVSFYLQREIQRDEKLHDQGRVSGLYNPGTPQELADRKKVFEQQADEVPVTPSKMGIVGNCLDAMQVKGSADEGVRTTEYSSPAEWEHGNKTEDVLSPCCPHRHPDERAQWILNSRSSAQRKVQSPESRLYLSPEEDIYATASDVKPINNHSTPVASSGFIYLSSYSPSPYVPSSSPSTPTDLRLLWPSLTGRYTVAQTGSREKFRQRHRRADTPEAIRKEIEHDFKREEELRLLRGGNSLLQSHDEGLDDVDKRAPSTGTTHQGIVMPPCNNDTPDLPGLKKVMLMSPEAEPGKSWQGLPSPWGSSATQTTLVTTKASSPLPSPSLSSFPSIPVVTAQPWNSPWRDSASPARVPALKPQPMRSGPGDTVAPKGLTQTLLEDLEVRRLRLKLEDNAYAGIQPSDDVNSEVLEAIRVTKHKNTRALQWEAGVFANKDCD